MSYNTDKARATKAGYVVKTMQDGGWLVESTAGGPLSTNKRGLLLPSALPNAPTFPDPFPTKTAAYAAVVAALGPSKPAHRPLVIGARGRGATAVQVYLDDADLGLVDGALVDGEKRTDFIRAACRALAKARKA